MCKYAWKNGCGSLFVIEILLVRFRTDLKACTQLRLTFIAGGEWLGSTIIKYTGTNLRDEVAEWHFNYAPVPPHITL